MKNKVTEEIKRSLLLMNYDSKKTLTEQTVNLPPDEESIDVPKKTNWEEVKAYIMSKSEPVTGFWPEDAPEYEYAKYKNETGNYMEAKSNGLAQESKPNYELVHTGSWKWNGKEVVFSWLATKKAGDQWDKIKERLKTNGIDDYKTYTNPKSSLIQTDFTYSDGEWAQGGYNYAKLVDADGTELEIKDNLTWRLYVRAYNNVLRAGKWSWNGSKIVFSRGVTKKSSGPLSEEDTDLNTAIMVKNKIGKIGAKGPAVKEIQYHVTELGSGNQYGTGDGCGDDSSKCTGIYDEKTKELVKAWQEGSGLKSDGLWGKESQRYYHDNPDEKEEESDID
jgi:hypothetical protein